MMPTKDPMDILKRVAELKHVTSKWEGKPLYGIKILANTSKGDLVEDFVAEYSEALGFTVIKNPTRQGDYDMKINGKKFEVKMATEDLNENFQFNHIRYDYSYNWLLCIGISPSEIRFQIYSKGDLAEGRAGVLVSMGRGQNASFKLTKAKSALRQISEYEARLREILA